MDLATGREVSVVADCVFQKVEDALQKVSSADAVGRVAVIVTESRLAQGQTLSELSGSNAFRATGSGRDSGTDENEKEGLCSVR